MKNINPIKTSAWKDLKIHVLELKKKTIRDLFSQEKNRFSKFSLIFEDQILVDFSKNIITSKTMEKLFLLAEECNLRHFISDMFKGKKINCTENKSVLHIALRNFSNNPIIVNKENIMLKVNTVLKKMKFFCNKIINGYWKGYTGKNITDIVHIGIGGSYIGPRMVIEALHPYRNHLKIHFISNIDGTNFTEVSKILNPETTLFLIASKTFSTQETLTNANSAKFWFLKKAKDYKYIKYHFIALSSNKSLVRKFGINVDNVFELWNWVGGRYSLWSSIGLSIALSIGFKNFKNLLSGAHSMDKHFYSKKMNENIPIILALISILYGNFFNLGVEAILPYDQYMYFFPKYVQQISMESNGKNIDRNGNCIFYETGQIIFGEIGTNGQHSFYQLIHQGTKIIPCDFIIPMISHNPLFDHHEKLISNFLAQTKALAFGKIEENIDTKVNKNKKTYSIYDEFEKHKMCTGNRPTNSILLRKINPYNLGALIALYEHKIFVQGIILNIYSFDQWGIEYGKELSNKLLSLIKNNSKKETNILDSSTKGIIDIYNYWKNMK